MNAAAASETFGVEAQIWFALLVRPPRRREADRQQRLCPPWGMALDTRPFPSELTPPLNPLVTSRMRAAAFQRILVKV